jgi:hypothetical protein
MLVAVINDGSDFCSKLLLHAFDDRFLGRPASVFAGRTCGSCPISFFSITTGATPHLYLQHFSGRLRSRGLSDLSCLGRKAYVNCRLRRRGAYYEFIAPNRPLGIVQHGSQQPMTPILQSSKNSSFQVGNSNLVRNRSGLCLTRCRDHGLLCLNSGGFVIYNGRHCGRCGTRDKPWCCRRTPGLLRELLRWSGAFAA